MSRLGKRNGYPKKLNYLSNDVSRIKICTIVLSINSFRTYILTNELTEGQTRAFETTSPSAQTHSVLSTCFASENNLTTSNSYCEQCPVELERAAEPDEFNYFRSIDIDFLGKSISTILKIIFEKRKQCHVSLTPNAFSSVYGASFARSSNSTGINATIQYVYTFIHMVKTKSGKYK